MKPLIAVLLIIASAGVSAAESKPGDGSMPVFRVEMSPGRADMPFLSWDTEGSARVATNLLRKNAFVSLALRIGGEVTGLSALPVPRADIEGGIARYEIVLQPQGSIVWDIQHEQGGMRMTLRGDGLQRTEPATAVLTFPFDPGITPTTVLPASWVADGAMRLPAVISAPDFGQILLSSVSEVREEISARLEGSRKSKTVDLILELPLLDGREVSLEFDPLLLAAPAGLKDNELWNLAARRGWWGALQPSARWGDQGHPFSAPAGILANNVISDPASCSLWFYADQALWTPELAPGVNVMETVRRTLDWWLDNRMRPSGEMVCYWDYTGFLDANAGPLIAAWDYVEATDDRAWLERSIDRLESVAEFLAQRDVDGDGMVEAVQSGNRNALQQPGRSCAWFDAINCGHKDGYTNAIIYRAWRCLAGLEARLGRSERAERYTGLAERLKGVYATTLFNPETGWLAWWKSEDGELHDYASPIINGYAIEYGLVEPVQGREILERLRRKMSEAGFTRFDLGVPPVLVPVHRSDYLQPNGFGIPVREDGTDTFGLYMNGGITPGQVLHFLAAHYVVGAPEFADEILRAMLERQQQGGFQNGVRDAAAQGVDWATWDGKPAGYEGYLADSYRFLQAVLLREPAFRERLYRPLLGTGMEP